MIIWIADLSAYNEGRLIGDHIDIEGMDAEDIEEAAEVILKRGMEACSLALKGLCAHEEWAVHDYEGPDFDLGEYPGAEKLVEVSKAVEKFSEGIVQAFMGWGVSSKKAYYEEMAEEFLYPEVPEAFHFYIDVEAWGRDWAQDEYIVDLGVGNGVVVFDGNR